MFRSMHMFLQLYSSDSGALGSHLVRNQNKGSEGLMGACSQLAVDGVAQRNGLKDMW